MVSPLISKLIDGLNARMSVRTRNKDTYCGWSGRRRCLSSESAHDQEFVKQNCSRFRDNIRGKTRRGPESFRFAVFAEIRRHASDGLKGRCTVVVGTREEEEGDVVVVVEVVVTG